MYVYFDYRVTTTVDAVTLKQVTCEHCGSIYHYAYRYTGQGQATSAYGLNQQGAAERSRRLAVQRVQNRLSAGIAPVACPKCGNLQADMVHELKRRLLANSQALGWVLPAVLIGISFGSALLASNFFDQPLSVSWSIGLGIISAIALAFWVWFGLRVLLETRTLTVNHHGSSAIPRGIEGAAPQKDVSTTVEQKAHSHTV